MGEGLADKLRAYKKLREERKGRSREKSSAAKPSRRRNHSHHASLGLASTAGIVGVARGNLRRRGPDLRNLIVNQWRKCSDR